MTSATLEALNELLAAYAFTRDAGLHVTELGDGWCELVVPYSSASERPGGILAGSLVMHAADVAFWCAIKTRLGMEDASVTSGMTTAFLEPARREDLTCRAEVLKVGRRLVYGVAECRASRRLVAHHTLTYARREGGGS
ncbi:MAG TPA: PaaI family thioesterase [Anaeromyxobacter sp.]|nr:PaaI family thioesterase [Anaeromyxobacter sp.]